MAFYGPEPLVEVIAAVAPINYPSTRPRLMDGPLRPPWNIFHQLWRSLCIVRDDRARFDRLPNQARGSGLVPVLDLEPLA